MVGVAGTVTSWKRAFGFVELKNGKTAYVHVSILPEGMGLEIGGSVHVVYEEVDGHDGRVKATGCTGAGVKAADTVKRSPKGEIASDKRKDTDGKYYTKAEFIEQYGGTKEWDARAAHSSQGAGRKAGAPIGGSKKGEEKRLDTDGKMYSRAEFVKQYGGTREWDARGQATKRAAVGGPIRTGGEKRKDTDGKWYTMEEFRKQYGGLAQWNARAPAPAASRGGGGAARGGGARGGGVAARGVGGKGGAPAPEEKRKDTDNKWYTRAEFVALYGGTKEWDAQEQRKDSDGKWYNKQSFKEVYGNLVKWSTAERRFPKPAAGGRGAGKGARGRGSG